MTRLEAQAAGQRFYDTGEPCHRGHFPAVRRVCSNKCLVCEKDAFENAREHKMSINRAAVARYRAKHPEKRSLDAKRRRAAALTANPDGFRRKEREQAKRKYYSNIDANRAAARQYAQDHPEANKARAAAWRKANPERMTTLSIRGRAKRKENWDRFLERERERYRRNFKTDPAKILAKGAARRATRLRATPSWADLDAIEAVYRRARQIAETTSIPQDVDHIVPLKGRNVCGLHVAYNLQIIPASANRRKWNKH
jgi:hypothetical protein